MSVLESLNWRYATKRMTGETVPQKKIDAILEAARLAPTSSGLQPFTILSVSDRELLEKIKPIANNQPQITEASHLLVFAAWDDITSEHIEKVFDLVIRERNLPAESLDNYKNSLKARFASLSREERYQAAARQAYIAFGVAIVAAAEQKVDATPMEGFKPAELDALLGLREKGLRSVTLLALGYRDTASDWLAKQKKVRRPIGELVIEL
ncbi:MAG TPA: nitroreductase family protein [Puia sp.]|nr:nitroreductase family protein [Puia sp.]